MQEKKTFKIVSTKKSRHLLPNALTLIGVCLGISSIKFALDGNYSLSVIFLLFAALLDGLDVFIRSRTNLPVFVSEDPLLAIVKGTGVVIGDIKKYVNDKILIMV